jgi:hypothetical protein
MPKVEWSNRGSSITVDQDKVRTGYVAVCAAISVGTGIEALHIQHKALNVNDYCQFLYWLRYMNGTEPLAIFMDNLIIHKTLRTMKAYQYLDILPLFNLAYTPDYNPIELVFSQVKKNFKSDRLQKLANDVAFDAVRAVNDAFYAIPAAKMDPCIRHSDALLRDMNRLA